MSRDREDPMPIFKQSAEAAEREEVSRLVAEAKLDFETSAAVSWLTKTTVGMLEGQRFRALEILLEELPSHRNLVCGLRACMGKALAVGNLRLAGKILEACPALKTWEEIKHVWMGYTKNPMPCTTEFLRKETEAEQTPEFHVIAGASLGDLEEVKLGLTLEPKLGPENYITIGTALSAALAIGDVEIARTLVRVLGPEGEKPGRATVMVSSALAEAAARGNKPMCELLLKEGAYPNLNSSTVAGCSGSAQCLELIIKAGGDPAIGGHLPLRTAIEQGRHWATELLLKHYTKEQLESGKNEVWNEVQVLTKKELNRRRMAVAKKMRDAGEQLIP